MTADARRPAGRSAAAWRAGSALLGAALSASCAAPLLDLPSSPGEPADDGAAVVAAATAPCRTVSTLVAEGAVSGSVDGQRVRGRLHLGVAEPASARLEAVAAFGQPIFILVARDGRATLLVTRPNRVLEHGDPAQVLEAVTGIPLAPEDLTTTLTGCAEPAEAQAARRVGADWRIVTAGSASLYFRRDPPATWRLVARVRRDAGLPVWRIEYHDFDGPFPATLRLVAEDRDRLDLRIALSQVERNLPLGDEVFEVTIPPDAVPVTLEELRRGERLGAPE